MWETYAKGGNDSQEWQDKYRDFYFSIMDTSGLKEKADDFPNVTVTNPLFV